MLHALVPVKTGPGTKSRLGEDGAAWAQVFLADVLDALLAAELVDQVSVVTSDAVIREICRARAVDVIDDLRDDLNGALEAAADQIGADADILIVLGDLPCLSATSLHALLTSAPSGRWFTADTAGTGTTMLFSPAGQRLHPAFGPRSRAAHRLSNAVEHPEAHVRTMAAVHRDVDTAIDLWDAARIGVGPHTAARIAQVGITP